MSFAMLYKYVCNVIGMKYGKLCVWILLFYKHKVNQVVGTWGLQCYKRSVWKVIGMKFAKLEDQSLQSNRNEVYNGITIKFATEVNKIMGMWLTFQTKG